MADLFPVFEIPDDPDDLLEEEPSYPATWKFDFELGDFVVTGGRVSEISDGWAAWVEWCFKALRTERFRHLAYTNDYGCEAEDAMRMASRTDAETLLENTVRETLEVDPRTGSVHSFEFAWDGDQVELSFVAEPALGAPQEVQVTYPARWF